MTPPPRREHLWWVGLAFLGHYPALRLLTRYRMGRPLACLNGLLAGATLAAMLGAGLAGGAWAAATAWLLGHLLWSALLAYAVYRNPTGAGSSARPRGCPARPGSAPAPSPSRDAP